MKELITKEYRDNSLDHETQLMLDRLILANEALEAEKKYLIDNINSYKYDFSIIQDRLNDILNSRGYRVLNPLRKILTFFKKNEGGKL